MEPAGAARVAWPDQQARRPLVEVVKEFGLAVPYRPGWSAGAAAARAGFRSSKLFRARVSGRVSYHGDQAVIQSLILQNTYITT